MHSSNCPVFRFACMWSLLTGLFLVGGSPTWAAAPTCGDSTEADVFPAPANENVTTIAEGGVWTWFNDERAVFVDSTLYVGYVDNCGQAAVTAYPLGEAGRLRTVLSSFREVDDHDNPAFAQLDDGRLLATYAMHSVENHWYWRTKEPGAFRWLPEEQTASVGAAVTYTNLFQLSTEDGRIYNFFRGLNFDPTLMTSDDGASTWSEPQHVIKSGGGGTRPYVKYVSDGEDRIDLFYTQGHPQELDARTNVYHLYYQNGTLHESDGTEICATDASDCLPVNYSAGTLVYEANDALGRGWVWDVEYTESGEPVGVFTTKIGKKTNNELHYHYARYDGATDQWQEKRIAPAGDQLYDTQYHYAGGISIDPAHPDTVYASGNVDPASGAETTQYQLYRGVTNDDGETWSWTKLTSASVDNLRPFVPRSDEGHHAVLWFRGEYSSYSDYDTDIVGLIGSQ